MAKAGTLTVADGPIEVELLPKLGARLHRLQVFGRELLWSPPDPEDHASSPFAWGAYVMAPWCNRIAAEATLVGDDTVTVPSNFPDGSAIHGQVYAAPWQPQADGSLRVVGGGDGWPWRYEVGLAIAIRGSVLRVELRLTNLAATPMPGGLGLHPWFRRPLDVRIDAGRVIPSNTNPAAQSEAVSGPFDLRRMRPMPDDLDATWLDPADPAVDLRWPELGIEASISVRSTAGLCIVAASPGGLGAVAVEPQTNAPQGLRRLLRGDPAALRPLAPGGSIGLGITFAFRRTS